MEDIKDTILNKIKDLKNKAFGETTIDCSFGDVKYKLVFLTADRNEDKNIIQLLSDWRKKHEIWFPSQFEVTPERTKKWFEERVIGASDRLLFMIEVNGEFVGHVGLFRFNFNDRVCDIDNILRGVDKYPGIIESAINNMMQWGKKEFGLEGYTLETASDNDRALKLYERMGFKEAKRVPLIKTNKNNCIEWAEAPEGYTGTIERYDVFMILK
jgi:RimJ/RimL family protein N-acetyltransferase